MNADFALEWEQLGKLAFRRHEKVGGLFKQVSCLMGNEKHLQDRKWLSVIKSWLLVPLTLWPVDFGGLAAHACKRLQSGKHLESKVIFILQQMHELPSEKAQVAISEYEKFVQQGNYEPLIRPESKCKYATQEKEVLSSRKLRKEWKELKQLFNADKFRDPKGIIRRRMAQERNFRPDWHFKWNTNKERFQPAFDAFCYRWNLYGMEGDKPLLLKLSVNPTAHGLMIVIPSYWSFDFKRDLDGPTINKIHKARGALRQGPQMSKWRLQRHKEALRAYQANQRAQKLKLRGKKRWQFIATKASLPLTTEARILRRLINEGARL
jgi:hypothetical protein